MSVGRYSIQPFVNKMLLGPLVVIFEHVAIVPLKHHCRLPEFFLEQIFIEHLGIINSSYSTLNIDSI